MSLLAVLFFLVVLRAHFNAQYHRELEKQVRLEIILENSQASLSPKEFMVCVATMDTRYTSKDLQLASSGNLKELRTRWDALDPHEKPFITQVLFINTAYTLYHGHTHFVSDGVNYAAKRNASTKHDAWYKVAYMRDLLSSQTNCEWIGWLDADSYFWMDEHRTSLNDFFATLHVDPMSRNFESIESQREKLNGYLPLENQTEIFLIATNGFHGFDSLGGYPAPYMSETQDFLCTGVFFIRNCPQGLQLTNDWWEPPSNASQELLAIYDFHWDQFPLNHHVFANYANQTSIFSFKDFHYLEGSGIRHIWRGYQSYRDKYMKMATGFVEGYLFHFK